MIDTLTITGVSDWKLSGQFEEDSPVRQVLIDRTPFVVGRRRDVSLTLGNSSVSGCHAELLTKGDQLFVHDLGSTNGTFVNGVRVNDLCELNPGDLVQFAQVVLRVGVDKPATQCQTMQNDSSDRALALIQFDKLLAERAVTPHYQPIVTMQRQTFAYEALGRSKLFGLSDPQTMFSAAAVLNLEAELSRILRDEALRDGAPLPGNHLLFVNTHPSELEDTGLLELSLREAREIAPNRPIVLEIHEATATNGEVMGQVREILNELCIGLAYDDFGAGQARLVEMADVPPDYLKFDISLIRGLGSAPRERQNMVARLVQMTIELGTIPLAEGVETQSDHEACQQMSFACAQGFLYGRPASAGKILGLKDTGAS
ncbi:Cyclic di-GMP phosphodiesterase Gmr [Posidoniimonas polymericola]|uniref:Cyclic di-GMP phosphodiesterase Gmr n=1 Tax=Posidoniimonas polymericola TaxID=2528002 RepID=A0A5C5YMM9_9BACT|nr:EAL domain-containing protein [Posidoniimonas polymericola]TWT76028.1 Cyclic di-GMP phosphodiesterase Gmr [Posidoniimonas polymericola]